MQVSAVATHSVIGVGNTMRGPLRDGRVLEPLPPNPETPNHTLEKRRFRLL